MNSIQHSDTQDYYDICKKLLSVCGQGPYQKPYERLLLMSINVICIISILFVQIAQFCICETTQCILQTLPLHLLIWLGFLKLLTCHFNKRNIKYLIERLHADWNILETEEEWEIMRRYALNGRWYSLIYACKKYSDTVYVYVATCIFGASTLLPRILDVLFPLNESRAIVMPCPAYYFVDETKYFYYIYLHLQFSGVICMAGLAAHDCIFITYVEHVCSLFAIVGFRFENFLYKRNITDKCLIDSSNDVYIENIAFSVQTHQRTLHFATIIEDTFSSSFALQILVIVMNMSASLTHISVELRADILEVVRYIVFVVGQLFHLFILSFQGQRLINHSLETHEKIYNGLWYNIPMKSQKLLLFAMGKSAEVISLSAGKIYIFSLESFTLVMKTSVSYFTVLSSFNEP